MNSPQASTHARRRISLLSLAGIAVLACLVARLAFIQGSFRPVRISGGSMAETLAGRHVDIRCDDCGFPFRMDAEAPPDDARAVCPNCGRKAIDITSGSLSAGERVLLDRLAYRLERPRRWELAAFRAKKAPNTFNVKRIVGLPNESISIRQGDIYVDGRIQRKTLAQLRCMALPVHDTAYEPISRDRSLPSRWRWASDASGWSRCGTAFYFSPHAVSKRGRVSKNGQAPVVQSTLRDVPSRTTGPVSADPDAATTVREDWLTYHHWRCMKGPWPRTDEYAVLDNYGYNQGVSRQLHRVTDLLLVCQARVLTASGTLVFRIHDGYQWLEIHVVITARDVRAFRGEQRLARSALPDIAYARGATFEVAICDRQLLMSVNRRPIIRMPYEIGNAAFCPTASPLQVGAAGGVVLERLQVFRDVHYLDPYGLGQSWTCPDRLGTGDVFVLGDNVPISVDSRHGEQGVVPRGDLLGRVWRLR